MAAPDDDADLIGDFVDPVPDAHGQPLDAVDTVGVVDPCADRELQLVAVISPAFSRVVDG